MEKQHTISSHDLAEENEKEQIRKYFEYKKDGVRVEVGSNEPISVYRPKLILLKDKHLYLTKHRYLNGEVVEAKDGLEERNPVHIVRDLAIAIKNALFFRAKNNEDLHLVLGNYIILKKNEGVFSLIAHAKNGSIKVSKGQKISEGQELAEVGHSGNSTAPHLHFQLMDRPNLMEAEGLPCCFKDYQLYKQGKWEPMKNGMPGKRERINA